MMENSQAIKHYGDFRSYYQMVCEKGELSPLHISFMLGLFFFHDGLLFSSPFRASRRKLMKYSGIRSVTTYHKCLSHLIAKGYLEYRPSWHPTKASEFRFVLATN
ncbi:hypothetical protein [Sphingobacterium paludis]|uniref:hypothetical protein n=1 Tax=Sphingobacterium paludis TaxID=1476465 RepID=UPI00105FB0DC|nr:hypothetical protein [Sphingobacterium paludis]